MDSTMTIRPPPPSPTSAPGKPPPTIPGPQPVPYFSHIGKSGQDVLWVGFVVFVLSTFAFALLGSRLPAKHRVFHHLMVAITGITALTYYAMATHGGTSYISTGWHYVQGSDTLVLRQVFWARYVNWLLTVPLRALILALLAGLPWVNLVSVVVVSEATTLAALFAGLQHDLKAATWGWFAIGCVLLCYMLYQLIWDGRKSAKHQHDHVSNLHITLTLYVTVIWIVHAVVFALSLGKGHLNPNGETIAYTVLDFFVTTVFGIWLLVVHKHDSEEAAVRYPDSWTEPRGGRRGLIHLPGGED